MNGKKGLGIHSFLTELLLICIVPMAILAVVLNVTAGVSMRKGLQREATNSLKALALAVKVSYTNLNDGVFSLNENGDFVKGEYNISEHIKDIDDFSEGIDMDVTIFYGDIRKATTILDASGKRIIGTKASAEVVDKVLKKGEDFSSYHTKINNKNYYAYYLPLENPDGSIVGMVFAGQPSEEVDSYIARSTLNVTLLAIVNAMVIAVVVVFIALKILKTITIMEKKVHQLSEGDLTGEIDSSILMRKDEFGLIAKALQKLQKELRGIAGSIQDSAGRVLKSGDELEDAASQSRYTADDVSTAVGDISKGALSQAEDIETATAHVNQMGEMIQAIVSNVESLNEISKSMQKTGEISAKTMDELSKYNDKTVEAVHKVSDNVKTTDDSVNEIAAAAELITSIASQTNMLSLNASIEAARAGEAGRGFAVVASEISKLSDESNESARKISDIIQELSRDSKNSLLLMEEVKKTLKEQEIKLSATKEEFEKVIEDIHVSRENTNTIYSQTQECDSARQNVVGIIENLSSISEENAAATQETTASMEELNSTINMVADSASSLKNMAVSLEEQTKFFKL